MSNQEIEKAINELTEKEEQYLREVFNLKPDEHPKTLKDLSNHTFKCSICKKTKKATQAIIDTQQPTTNAQKNPESTTYTITQNIRVICKACWRTLE